MIKFNCLERIKNLVVVCVEHVPETAEAEPKINGLLEKYSIIGET
jgi:hypothetical protein